MRIICVAGARPNYMKIKPVIDALDQRGVDVVLVHSGQHYDAAMNDVFFDDLGIRPPDHLPRRRFGQPCHPDVSCHDRVRAAGRAAAP